MDEQRSSILVTILNDELVCMYLRSKK